MPRRRIIIIGGGFAGADLARSLRGKLPYGWEVVLFSRENHFVFTPLLAEVVGSAIDPRHVVWAIREMTPGTACRTVAVRKLDLERREVIYEDSVGGEVREAWDHLVLACGLDVNLGMIPGMAQHAWPVKRLGDALALRNHVIQQLERAESEPDGERRAQLLSFAVVGGGFTGIELAGSIMDLLIDATRFYQRFDRDALRVTVVEGAPRILATLPESLSAYAERDLRARGLTLLMGQHVKEIRADGIALGDGSTISASTVITAVGNKTQPLLEDTPLPKERGRLIVSGTMRVDGREDIWALGDCAAVPNGFDNQVSPTLGQFSIRQATQLAENLIAVVSGKPPRHARHLRPIEGPPHDVCGEPREA